MSWINIGEQRKLIQFFSILALVVLLLPDSGFASEDTHGKKKHTVHWEYSGSAGPSNWGTLKNEFAVCKSGLRQSPVDLTKSKTEKMYPLKFLYNSLSLQAVNNGHTLQANFNDVYNDKKVTIGSESFTLVSKQTYSSTLMVGDVPYSLLQLHFHSPSEHAVNGKRYAMEVHLVHKAADGNLAVIGVLLKEGRQNAELQNILDTVSSNINEVTVAQNSHVNATALLPSNRNFYHYSGSLTTPPCSENVNWFVMKTPSEVSSQQINRFTQLLGENARPLQPMNWRRLFDSL